MSAFASLAQDLEPGRKYEQLIPSLRALFESESDLIANMANFCAVIQGAFLFHWTGFYLVKEDQLVLGPFQGPPACTRISKGRGVCGTAWKEKRSVVVQNVHDFPGHIACSPYSNSEIVIPLFDVSGEVTAVLDIDSTLTGFFDQTHIKGLEACASTLQDFILKKSSEKI